MSSTDTIYVFNKSAYILAFDEFMTSGSTFEGNNMGIAIQELKYILNLLIRNEIFYDEIDLTLLTEFNNLEIANIETISENENLINDFLSRDRGHLLCGWIRHGIMIFFEKTNFDVYNIGIINCGEGVELHGIGDELCNGILILKNIKKKDKDNCFRAYFDFFNNKNFSEIHFSKYKMYAFVYFIFTRTFYPYDTSLEYLENCEFDIYELIELGYIDTIKANKQIIGSCTFTNMINYIVYMLSNKGIVKSNDVFIEWYKKAKVFMKNHLRKEILNNFSMIESIEQKTSYVKNNKNVIDLISSINNQKLPKEYEQKNVAFYEQVKKIFPTKKKINISKITNIEYSTSLRDKFFNIISDIGFGVVDVKNDGWFENLNVYETSITTLDDILKCIKSMFSNNTFDETVNIFYDKLFKPYIEHEYFDFDKLSIILASIILVAFSISDTFVDVIWELRLYLIIYELTKKYEFKINRIIFNNIYTILDRLMPEHHLLKMFVIFGFGLVCVDNFKNDYVSDPAEFDTKKQYFKHIFSNFPLINGRYFNVTVKFLHEIWENIDYFPINYIKNINGNEVEFNLSYIYSNFNEKFVSKILMIDNESEKIDILFDNEYRKTDLFFAIVFGPDNQIESEYVRSFSLEKINDNILFDYICTQPSQTFIMYDTSMYFNVNVNNKSDFKNGILYDFMSSNINNDITNISINIVQKYIIFKKKIYDELMNLETIKYHNIIKFFAYFYLCECFGIVIENELLEKFDRSLYTFICSHKTNEQHTVLNTLITQFCCIYGYDCEIGNVVVKLDHTVFINKFEKQHFKSNKYNCKIKNDPTNELNYYSCDIDFYLVKINNNCRLVVYRHDNFIDGSIKLIHNILNNTKNHDNYSEHLLFLCINYTFISDINDGNVIKGFKKNKKNNYLTDEYDLKIYTNESFLISNIELIEDSVTYNVVQYNLLAVNKINKKTEEFYKIVSNIDDFIITYSNSPNKIYFKLDTFDVTFAIEQLSNNRIIIKTKLNDIDYVVTYSDSVELYLNFGIFNIYDEINNNSKLLGFYDYKKLDTIIFPEKKIYFDYNSFTNNPINVLNFTNIKNSFQTGFYKIIDNNCLKNIEEVLVILTNSFMWNSFGLVFKFLYQIKTIINNSELALNKNSHTSSHMNSKEINLINLLFKKCTNIYGLFLCEFLYQNNYLTCYHYELYNKLTLNKTFKFIKSVSDDIYNISKVNIEVLAQSDIMSFNNFDLKLLSRGPKQYNYIRFDMSDNEIIVKKNMESIMIYEFINYAISIVTQSTLLTYEINNNILKNFASRSYDKTINKFYLLLKNNIHDLDKSQFGKNLEKSIEMSNYLFEENKQYLHPIQEIIMGMGKSSTITPCICLLLIYKILKKYVQTNNLAYLNRQIYLVMPSVLIEQSFQIIMQNLIPICKFVDVCYYKYNKVSTFNNTVKIILISDTELKELYIDLNINTDNSYFIYDEIDMMSNPMTSELNMPFGEKNILSNLDAIYKLTNVFYNNLFLNQEFWNEFPEKTLWNGVHNYFFKSPNTEETIKINNFWDEMIANQAIEIDYVINSVSNYFKSVVIPFLLTNQFNLDYGLPEVYIGNFANKYKFKAIPYNGVNSPIYGSEFSDIFLVYVLTFFAYKLSKNKMRLLDKIEVTNLLCDYINKNRNQTSVKYEKMVINFFNANHKPHDIEEYINMSDHYNNFFDVDINLDNQIFEIYLKGKLSLNVDYYTECKNINFVDLMLHNNIKNYVGFTGTAYMSVPIDNTIGYMNKEIEYGLINGEPIEKIVENIIDNKKKLKFYHVNRVGSDLIESVIKCLDPYDVLIDIGGFFVDMSNEKFIKEYYGVDNAVNRRKKYFYYFDNGPKIYDSHLQMHISNFNNNRQKDTFFYFSNKHITGVDAKKFMNTHAHGLVTISSNTILRDFAQGIFRMRNINLDQTIDLITDIKMHTYIKIDEENEANDFDLSRVVCPNLNFKNIKRNNLFGILKQNQINYDTVKLKMLYKQNIIGLLKTRSQFINNSNTLILYEDPMIQSSENDNSIILDDFYYIYGIQENYFINDINDKNLYLKCTELYNSDVADHIINLIDLYNNVAETSITNMTNKNTNIEKIEISEKSQELKLEIEEEKLSQIFLATDANSLQNFHVDTNFGIYLNNIKIKNMIFYQNNNLSENIRNSLVIYDHRNNVLSLFAINLFVKYLSVTNYFNQDKNKFYDRYSLISLFDDHHYSEKYDYKTLNILKYAIVTHIMNSNIEMEKINLINDVIFYNENRDEILTTISRFQNMRGGHVGYKQLYIDYKTKYLEIKKRCKKY